MIIAQIHFTQPWPELSSIHTEWFSIHRLRVQCNFMQASRNVLFVFVSLTLYLSVHWKKMRRKKRLKVRSKWLSFPTKVKIQLDWFQLQGKMTDMNLCTWKYQMWLYFTLSFSDSLSWRNFLFVSLKSTSHVVHVKKEEKNSNRYQVARERKNREDKTSEWKMDKKIWSI